MIDTALRIFQMAAMTENFTRTASALQMTQPNVSAHIRRLEKEIGAALFTREGHNVKLTPAGRSLLKSADQILELSGNAARLARNAARENHCMNIGATMTAGGYVLPLLAGEFKRRNPGFSFGITVANTQEITERLKRGVLDFALVEGPFDSDYFLSRELLRDRLVIAGHRDMPLFKDGGAADVCELMRQREPLALRESGSGTRYHFENFLRGLGRELKPRGGVLELNCPEAIKSLLRGKYALTVISELCIRHELDSGEFKACDFAEGAILRPMHFIYLPDENMKLHESFIRFCRRQVASVPSAPVHV
ncbi:MAG: LysR substrate-binding domain-containing protein [Victivallaceae bacterium]